MAAKSTPKRARSNSIAGTTETIARVLAANPAPTEPLNDREMEEFNRILLSKSRADTSDYDVSLITQLAKVVCMMNEATVTLRAEGYTMTNDRGTTICNPLISALDSFSRSVATLSKMLGLSASQKGASAGDNKKFLAAENEARKNLAATADQDLI